MQDGHEALHRAEQGAVDHDRPVPAVVGPDVLEPEALGQLEVQLHRRHLPGAPDGVARLHRDLGAVEGAPALVHDQVQADPAAARSVSVATSQSSSLPDGLARRLGRQLEVEVVQPVVAQEVEHEVQGADQLAPICSRVQKMWASSWVMPRTRVRPWSTPDFS